MVPSRRAVHRSAVAVAAVLLATLGAARADESPATGHVDLKGCAIKNQATVVSFPISPEKSLVLGLHEGFWLQAPRYMPAPTALSGTGMIVQYQNAHGGSPSLLYLGSQPLTAAREGEDAAARFERDARAFVEELGAKYRAVEFELLTAKVPLALESIRMGGKKTPAWHAGPYQTKPAGEYGGTRSVLAGHCVLFQPEGLEVLAYVALDMRTSGTTLERALADASIQPTVAVHKAAHAVQLNDITAGEPGRFPVRLLAYESPTGFVIAPSVITLDGEWVYAEERLDSTGAVTASWRIRQLPAERERDPAADGADVRTSTDEKGATALKRIPLATPRVNAYAFSHTVSEGGRTGRSRTAVVRLDDFNLVCTWVTWGKAPALDAEGTDLERVTADDLAFEKLLGGMQVAIRW